LAEKFLIRESLPGRISTIDLLILT